MSKFSFPNATNGLDDAFVGIAQSSPEMSLFIPLILMFIFGTVFISGFTGQRRRTGQGDAPLWATLAGISTTLVMLIMTTKQGLVDPFTLSTTLGITVLCGIWLIRSKGRYE